MSLEFESVSLQNFGPYRSIVDLNLLTHPEAPIVVIHGENTLGKTSLFRALRWCLYGAPEAGKTPGESARSLNEYMNRPAFADGETAMQVSMKFTADSQKFYLTRTARFDGGGVPKVTADLRIDAEVIQPLAIEAEIGRQLHPQISEFFLFDGELLRDFYDRLNSDRERDLLKQSIESVLGIPALQLAGRDISVMAIAATSRQAKAIKNRDDAATARRQLAVLKSRQESIEKDRTDVEKALRKAQVDLEDVNEQIAGVDELKADAREMETLEAAIKGGEAEERQIREDMRNLLTSGWLAPASAKLSAALKRVEEKNDNAQRQQKAVQAARERVDVLQKQIRGGTCPTCRQELPPPGEATRLALASAENDLARLKAAGGDEPDLRLERRIRELIDTSTLPAYHQAQERLNKVLSTQYSRNRRLSSIKDRLKGNDAAAIRKLAYSQQQLEGAIEKYGNSLRQLGDDQAKVQSDQNRQASAIRRLANAQPDLGAEAYFFEYVQQLIERTIERYQERTRADVERTSTAMFMKLIRDPEGYEGIRIGRDYRVELIGRRGPAMKTSEGGRQLIALSLIGALKRAAVRGGPVVLDSPLARLDLEHRANVLQEWVPELGNQAILLVQSGELTEEQARDIMGNRIGQAYRIYRPNDDPEEADIVRTQ